MKVVLLLHRNAVEQHFILSRAITDDVSEDSILCNVQKLFKADAVPRTISYYVIGK